MMEATFLILTEPLHPVEDIQPTVNIARFKQCLTLAEEAVPMILGYRLVTSVVTTMECKRRYIHHHHQHSQRLMKARTVVSNYFFFLVFLT